MKALILNNLKLLLKLRFGDLYSVSKQGNYWKISSVARTLNGYEIKRLVKFKNGISSRLKTLSLYFGLDLVYEVKKGDVVIDIGANIGEFSTICLERGAKVLSVEPDDNVIPCLKKNLARFTNSLGLEQSVISNVTGNVEFFQSPSKADSSIIQPEKFDKIVSIPSLTLDDLYDKYNLGTVSLIKCDAEGAEPEVLASCTKTLSNTKVVAFNCGPERFGEITVNEVRDILVSHGFNVQIIDGYNPQTVVIGFNPKFSN